MLIQGSIGSNKTELLIKEYLRLKKNGIPDSSILVLLQNPYKKADFIKKAAASLPDTAVNNAIYTFAGLCYNAFLDNWEFISKFSGVRAEKPNLCGLEVSQYIFKESIKTADFTDYVSKINLLHQLFRRYSLTVQNCFSDKDVLERSKILNETFAIDAQKAVNDYKMKTFEYNSFDYLRQLAVLSLIYNNTDYFKNIKYLIADDADEFSFAFRRFIDKLMPQLDDYFIGFDDKGSSRCGYLCAYKSGINDFIKNYSPEIIQAEDNSKFKELSVKIFNTVKSGGKLKLAMPYVSEVKRFDMLEKAAKRIKELLKTGVKESEIAIVTPMPDEILPECFKTAGIKFQILSGSEKLFDDEAVKYIIITLKLINGIDISEYERKKIYLKLLKIPYQTYISNFKSAHFFSAGKMLKQVQHDNNDYKFCKYYSLIEAQRQAKNTLVEQIKILGKNLLDEFQIDYSISKFNFLVKEAQSFETAFKNSSANIAREFIIQTANTIISENPSDAAEIQKDKILIAPPQKIIDCGLKAKYLLLFDISSSEWIKNDTGTLYNAWVLSRDYNKNTFTIEDNIELTNDKTARMLRKLVLCSDKEIILLSSLYDNTGNENTGGISNFIKFEDKAKTVFNITPRPDQMPVLDYKGGRLGITAVPGAGKTTILLALVIKLLQQGFDAENIFILTYMDSAAKNFKERLKAALSDNFELPNISTIHGLALRIIKENGSISGINLDENFEICDDAQKETIIRGLFSEFKIDEENYENYAKSIAEVKSAGIKDLPKSKYKEITAFFDFYGAYNRYLKENNLIDYDDMLIYAVRILEENQKAKEHYQNLCRIIIEDEAQDSTDIQQKLTGILTGKYNNLVRCGDINQSITSTFTNSNPKGFLDFIQNNKKTEMTSSQRCSIPIFTFANNFLKEALKTSDAFYNIEIKGTEKNPKNTKKPEYLIFETEKEEKSFIINKIKEIKKEMPKASIAVLLRLNSQAEEYSEALFNEGISVSSGMDFLSGKNIYRIIYSLLKIIDNPLNNDNIIEFALLCRNLKLYNIKQCCIDFLNVLESPFVLLNPDELNSEGLLQLYYDIDYFLNLPVSADILAFEAGMYFERGSADKSNAYMISSLIKKLETNSLDELLERLDYAAHKNSGAYKFFEDNNKDAGSVSIMTMHKSKGSEFDYVFIPCLNEENYPSELKNVKLKSGGRFVQTISSLVKNTAVKTPEELKKEQLNENLRLLYTGMTRAKQELYFTNAVNYKRRKNTKSSEAVKLLCRNP